MSRKAANNPYPDVDPSPNLPALEQRVLDSWERDQTFLKSIDQRPAGDRGSNEFVFYGGPPFANGLPHHGHLVTGYIKDIVPRYQTLRGRRVERRFGWDCHGLPVEMLAEKELGVHGHKAVADYGIDRFNEYCESSVFRYVGEWKRYVNRAARWVDFENDYKTLELPYMESLMWAVKQLHEKGLLYEGYKVMPYSWAAETVLSNFETRQDDAYRDRQDPAVTVRFELESKDDRPTDLLAWTTTPWTLPSNLAIAVGPELDYAIFELDGRNLILGEATVAKYEKELADASRVGSLKGHELVGRKYTPLFPFFADTENAFRVLGADFVDTEEGTGVVHMAPGFGEDDMQTCNANDIPTVVPVDDAGCFTAEVPPWQGVQVFDANKPIVRELKERGVIIRHETYTHSYPHCWRTREPLIYKAMDSWYVRVTAIRERAVELNQQINWIPANVRDGRFGKWLEGAIDWSISRNRFWGTPIPIWKSDDPAYPRMDVYGSLDEIERDFGRRPTNLHRPDIDDFVRPNPDDPTGKSMMRRVPEVLDCWFESGSMPFAQVHYPFENKEWFDDHFPADFIVEYLAQTRGWFYTMHVLATAIFDRPAFKNCICHGVILGDSGQKLSKSLRNYTDPEDIFQEIGSDALRWFLVSSPVVRGGDLTIRTDDQQVRDAVRVVIKPIWNAWYFFALYANTDGIRAKFRTDSEQVLDRYILAKTSDLVTGIAESLDAYDLSGACQRFVEHLDALNNWYIRRSRDRFWRSADADDPDKQDAYDTLYTVLVTLCQVVSPLLPLVTEEIYRGLTGEESVHLTDWPTELDASANPQLVGAMDRVRDVCSAALALRASESVRVRQPLASLTVAGADTEQLRPYAELIADEVNIKELRLTREIDEYATFRLQVNSRALGPRLGKDMKKVLSASKTGDWKLLDSGNVECAGFELAPGEYAMLLQPKKGVSCEALPTSDAIVVLDLELSDALIAEGRARDVVRVVQQARKEADFHVSDRIRLALELPADWRAAVERFGDYVREQTLANQLDFDGSLGDDFFVHEATLGGNTVRIGVARDTN
ncbi:MAG: isoleucine--tRNA ligase [Myxococcota bacterium]